MGQKRRPPNKPGHLKLYHVFFYVLRASTRYLFTSCSCLIRLAQLAGTPFMRGCTPSEVYYMTLLWTFHDMHLSDSGGVQILFVYLFNLFFISGVKRRKNVKQNDKRPIVWWWVFSPRLTKLSTISETHCVWVIHRCTRSRIYNHG